MPYALACVTDGRLFGGLYLLSRRPVDGIGDKRVRNSRIRNTEGDCLDDARDAACQQLSREVSVGWLSPVLALLIVRRGATLPRASGCVHGDAVVAKVAYVEVAGGV